MDGLFLYSKNLADHLATDLFAISKTALPQCCAETAAPHRRQLKTVKY